MSNTTSLFLTIVFTLIAIASGCSRKSETTDKSRVAKNKSEDQSQALQTNKEQNQDGDSHTSASRPQPEMIIDQNALAECKRKFKEKIKPLYDEAITSVLKRGRIDAQQHYVLKQNSEESVPALMRLMNDKSKLPQFRVFAAMLLTQLGNKSGEAFLLENVQSENYYMQLASVSSVLNVIRKIDTSKNETQELLLSLLLDEDKDIAELAEFICVEKYIPGIKAKAEKTLSQRKNNSELSSETTVHSGTTVEEVEGILKRIVDFDSGSFHIPRSTALDSLVAHENPDVAAKTKKLICKYLLGLQEDRYHEALVRQLSKYASNDEIDELKDILVNAETIQARSYALEGLARLQPEKAVDRIVKFEEDNKPYGHFELLVKYVTAKDFDKFGPDYVKAFSQPDCRLHELEVQLLLNLGEKGKQLLKSNMDKLSDEGFTLAKWKIDGLNLEMALDDLDEAKIIKTEPAKLIDQLRQLIATERMSEFLGDSYDLDHPYSLYRALANTKIDIRIFVETEHKACCHEMLIGSLSQDVFEPFSPSFEVQFQSSNSSNANGTTSVLQFVYENKLFRTELRNSNDGYDIESVVNLINFALKQTGKSKRFIRIRHAKKSFAHFVFADPDRFIPIAGKYGIPIDAQYNLYQANDN